MTDRHTGDLFEASAERDPSFTPLAERMRPRSLDEFVGQDHVLGPGKMLRKAIETDRIPSMILWGPPGVGKTTLARLLAAHTGSVLEVVSAVSAGVRDLRRIVEVARDRRRDERRATLLFVDEIHRFNRAQQDALLPHVEAGICRLIGATTENPSFEVNAALLSRARVIVLRELTVEDIVQILRRALADRERGLGRRSIQADDRLLRALARTAQGDARRALTTLEVAIDLLEDDATLLSPEIVGQALGDRNLRYDKDGEEHYNVVSAYIKSMRASDPDAAVYWLARMLEAGEDPMFVARRAVIFASEDIGNADPQALCVATAAASATHLVGMPEAVLALSQATQYLALAAKSNSALAGYSAARRDVKRHGALPVPLVVRNAVTQLMKQADYGRGYRYPHDFGGVDPEHGTYLPEAFARSGEGVPHYVTPGTEGWEADAHRRLLDRRAEAARQRVAPAADATDDDDPNRA